MNVDDIEIPRLRLSISQQEEFLKTILWLHESGNALKDIAAFFMENDRMQRFGEALNDLVEAGHKTPLATCLSNTVSREALVCITAGEETGQLVNGLSQAAYVTGVSRRISSQAGPPAFYVLLYIFLGVFAGALFALYIIPQFKTSLPPAPPRGGPWPSGVQALFTFSDVVGSYGIPFAIFVAVAGGMYGYLALRGNGGWRDQLGFDNWPGVHQWMMYQLAVFSINLGGMYRANVKLDIAMQKMVEMNMPPPVQRHLEMILDGLGEGLQEKAFDTGWFDSLTFMMFSGAYASGRTGDGLENIGNMICERLVTKMTRMAEIFKMLLQMYVLSLAVFMYWGMSQIGRAMT